MSTQASVLPARTPRSAFGKLLNSEAKYAWRAPLGLLLGVAAPVLALVVLGLIPGANKPLNSFDGSTAFSVYFPALIAFALAVLALFSLPIHLATYREQGILRADVHHAGAPGVDPGGAGHHQPRPGRGGPAHPRGGGHRGVWPGRTRGTRRVHPGPGAEHRCHVRHRAVGVGHCPLRECRRWYRAVAVFPLLFFSGLFVPRAPWDL